MFSDNAALANGTEEYPLEMKLKNVDICIRDDAILSELIRGAYCKRITFENANIPTKEDRTLL